ncbi:LMBR1 domain-containing protein 1 [Klebsormidium nitens]|uniref:LMBR1 domain-containing protein 1 n=1 Tax=Klebsormidium nitens TaxID=105231 RepID=A0A1Y1I0N0_KLENI|nr:LMBR1 domain-containing protein 1 [Klebsormidium nitens]|eukprot:GAQ82999.1 LMBR1 domain-containing protein 1 [Klebsormidium nitens]
MSDFSVFLIVLAVIISVLVVVINIYVLINYQHPDDRNQAYFPKFIVVFGLTVAQLSILMLPLDVANRNACQSQVVNGACNLTLPMKELWYAIYIVDAVLVFLVIPFTVFFYEADQEKTATQRITSALLWSGATAVVFGLILGICYGLVGYVDYPVRRLVSSTVPISIDSFSRLSQTTPCFDAGRAQGVACDALQAPSYTGETWTIRTTFPVYVIAITTIVGSVLFSIFGGIGIMCLPLDMIFAFLRRPTAVISRSEYIKEATDLAKRSKDIRDVALALQREERSGNKGRNWRKNVRRVERELLLLEEDETYLTEMYPQGEQPEALWIFTVLRYFGNLFFGLIGIVASIAWIIHIIIYVLIKPPLSQFLNQAFVKLDEAWGLLGTVAFAAFCFYLFLCLMAGEMKAGFNLLIFTIHPMKSGKTLMNSFLFNVALILLCSSSVILFCQSAFAVYAQETAVSEIFGQQLQNLRGIKYLFRFNIFPIAFVVFALLTLFWYLAFGWRKRKVRRKMTMADLNT